MHHDVAVIFEFCRYFYGVLIAYLFNENPFLFSSTMMNFGFEEHWSWVIRIFWVEKSNSLYMTKKKKHTETLTYTTRFCMCEENRQLPMAFL